MMESTTVEIKPKLLDGLKRKDDEMSEKVVKLGLKDENFQEVLDSSKILQKWGTVTLDKYNILADFAPSFALGSGFYPF